MTEEHRETRKPIDPMRMLSEKSDRLQTKLDVLVLFLHERLRIRDTSMESLDQDEKSIRDLLQAFEDRRNDGRIEASTLESALVGHGLAVDRERRSQEAACWQDLFRLMQQMLQVWESSEEAKSKESMVRGVMPRYQLDPEQDYSAITTNQIGDNYGFRR